MQERTDVLWRVLIALLLILLAFAVADLLVTTFSILFLVFAGILFGVFVNGISNWLSTVTPISYRWSFIAVVVLLVALIAAGVIYMGVQIAERATRLWAELKKAGDQLTQQVAQYEWAREYFSGEGKGIKMLTDKGGVGPELMQGMQWLMWGITGAAVIFFVGLYVAYEPELYRTGMIKLVPHDRRKRAGEVLDKLQTTLSRWIVGRLISMSLIGVSTTIGLFVLGVPLPFTLGVLAALLTFIPNLGPVLAAVPQALLALQVGTTTVLYVLLLNIALQTIESYIITPIVQRYEVTLPPALTISVQLLFAVFAGTIGLMMAAPFTAAVLLVVQMLYIGDRLGDPSPGRLSETV